MPAELFKALNGLRTSGRTDEARTLLERALRAGQLPTDELEKAGRYIAKNFPFGDDAVSVRLLGQCTTSWLVPVLTAIGLGRGTKLAVSDGEYDNIVQELVRLHDPVPQILVLIPWTQRVLDTADQSHAQRIDDELGFWQQVWATARGKGVSRILQVGYDWTQHGALGHHLDGGTDGQIALIRELNQQLRRNAPAGTYFVDLEQVSGGLGRSRFYDPRSYHWTKQPFSTEGVARLCEHIFAGIRALTSGPKKVLVLDLDNTLWGGVVGETGPLDVALGESADGESFRTFQKFAKGLSKRGVLLAVASKNNPQDAREPFERHPDMVLALDDFAAFEASWDSKAVALRRIAETLSLGLDSFVFFDDNPAEREHIRQALPEVEVVDVPEEPAEYVRALQAGLWFESVGLTNEDRGRTEQYIVERKRTELQAGHANIDDYLASLAMSALVRDIDAPDLQRVVQLIGKTNQFNLTTRRHSEEQVNAMVAQPGSICLTLRLKDRFGDYGLVAVVLAVPVPNAGEPTLMIDTWLMSCRVIGRSVEQFVLRELATRAVERGYRQLLGEYIPTKKNALVARMYDDLGFARTSSVDGTSAYRLELPAAALPRTFVAVE